jgi:NAD(P)-dependent dehydrogenase (short-subunit alcohol dehydrogenase family)
MKISNATALVTGANRGLGRALVGALLRAGATRVYATARDARKLEPVVAVDPERIVPLALDVTSNSDIEAAAARATDVTLLVNNAGTLASYGLLSSSATDIATDFASNFHGPLALIKAFLPALERAKSAAIVNILSVVSLASRPVIGGYGASKAAMFSATQGLRPELDGKGIAVHAVFPGAIDTDMIRAFPIPKTSADDVATAIVDGVVRGDEDILPDSMGRDVFATWAKDPKAFERYFGRL